MVWGTLLVLVVYPALETLARSLIDQGTLSLKAYQRFFIESEEGSRLVPGIGLLALGGSLVVSCASVFLAALIGIPLAFLVERNRFPGRNWLASLAFLPLTLPPIVGVVSFDLIFSEAGILPRCLALLFGLDQPPFYLSGRDGVIAIHGYSFFPFFFFLVSNALREMDNSLIEASRSLGMSRWRTLLLIEFPMLIPALYGAAIMVFMASMASFSAPLLFDVEGLYLSTYIYNLKTQDLWQDAFTATTLFMGASLSMLLFLRFLRGSRHYQPLGKGVPRKPWKAQSLPARCCLGILAWAVLILLLLPHLGILLWSFTQDGSWTWQLLPPGYTLENYRRILGLADISTDIVQPVRNSAWMAGIATLANLAFGIAAAFLLKARSAGNKAITDLLVMLPWALPGTVIAINLLVTFGQPSLLTLGLNLSQTAWLLPMAYFIRNIPLVVRPLAAAWEQVGESVEEAARSLGAGRLRTLRTVSIPLLFPALVGGGLLAFVTALGEFIASAILFTPGNKPISVAIFGEFHAGAYGLCSAYGVFLILLIGAVMLIGGRSSQRIV
ncbi:MAG: iron ABC transporter permease [Candidatus Omnitrophica bacterium]|nr:iron ABC transporter permease [Candidatus Omnitrophota bacterium]MCL4736116.1 iron ABC transporter permease [Candidatus Omnitrophota bacterium]